MTKLQYQNKSFIVTVPKTLVKLKGWSKGDELVFVANSQGNLELTKIK